VPETELRGENSALQRMNIISDCLIIGGGPAGLTAAIYLSRFHLDVRVIDNGKSRALWIPCSHNHAGFPEGVTGKELLQRMRTQAKKFGSVITSGLVTRLETGGDSFEAEWGAGVHRAKTVLLATGVRNRRPSIDEDLHEVALREGFIRYCPVCDGYEVTDKSLAVIGTGEPGVDEAVFLRSYSARVTLIAPNGQHELDAVARRKVADFGIVLADGPSHVAQIEDGQIVVEAGDARLHFDSIYPALGSDTNSDLAIAIGADTNEFGCVRVDGHQRASVPGLYAAGDVVIGLDQISHAMGEGGVAATTIRNDLAEIAPLLR
jgi:thioredoxin reductase (NADPH)